MNKWISADQLPETNDDVLVWFEYFGYNGLHQECGICHTINGKWSRFVNGKSEWRELRLIAWQPLPESPKEER